MDEDWMKDLSDRETDIKMSLARSSIPIAEILLDIELCMEQWMHVLYNGQLKELISRCIRWQTQHLDENALFVIPIVVHMHTLAHCDPQIRFCIIILLHKHVRFTFT